MSEVRMDKSPPNADRPLSRDPFRGSRPRPSHAPSGLRLTPILAVAAGGALGGSARMGIEALVPTTGGTVLWATSGVNVAGAFVLAVLLTLIFEVWAPRPYLRPFLAVGLLGSFTTFSTWMLEVHSLTDNGHSMLALGYLMGSLTAGLAATSLGLILGRGIVARQHRAREMST